MGDSSCDAALGNRNRRKTKTGQGGVEAARLRAMMVRFSPGRGELGCDLPRDFLFSPFLISFFDWNWCHMPFSKRIVVVLRYERRETHTTVLYGREFEMKSREFDWIGWDRIGSDCFESGDSDSDSDFSRWDRDRDRYCRPSITFIAFCPFPFLFECVGSFCFGALFHR
jgi:hypothetical protein